MRDLLEYVKSSLRDPTGNINGWRAAVIGCHDDIARSIRDEMLERANIQIIDRPMLVAAVNKGTVRWVRH